ncbi:MAG: tripartite tricarboxylate transporter substrate binding protein [Albidovulum sp.]|nr:tripartite tricarboxylate transporter substrate binding protein [Albidovulum sp.]
MMKRLFGTALAATIIAFPAMAEYPEKDIELIVPYGAGGGTDTAARLIQPHLEAILGQNLIITNMPGAGGTVGATNFAKSNADGYTLAFLPAGTAVYQPNLRDVAYDENSFAPICMTINDPVGVSVGPDSPIGSLDDLIAAAKADTISAGTASPGSIPHVGAVLLERAYGVKLKNVPLENSAKISTAVLGGHVDMTADLVGNAIKFGLKPLAVLADERLDSLPDVPTIDELGGPPIRLSIWFALYAPAGTPQTIVDKLSESCEAATSQSAYQDSVMDANRSPHFMGSADLSDFFQQEFQRIADLFMEIGLKK